MKRTVTLLLLTCLVVSQKKTKAVYLTECKGGEENGQVIFKEKVLPGQEITFSPFIVEGDEIIHGKIMGIQDPQPQEPKPAASTQTFKID